MARVERTTRLSAPSSAVWSVLADFGAISAWAPNVDHSCLLSSGNKGVGTVRRVQSGRTTLRETVVAWEPGGTLAYAITGLPQIVRSVTNTWQLRPTEEGTDVTIVSEIVAASRPPGRIAERVVARVLGSASVKMLAGLARHLDSTGSDR